MPFRLNIADKALNLLNNLTTQLIELETRLTSQTSLIDDENHIHRQLNELNDLNNHIQILEKSITELLILSKQLNNDRLIRISEQLATRWKQIMTEITQRLINSFFKIKFIWIFYRKRSITQIIESYRLFKTLFEQEERILNHFEKRLQTLEPLSTKIDKLRRMTKTVTVRKRKSLRIKFPYKTLGSFQ